MVSSPVIPVAMAEAPVVPLPDHEDATTRHLVRVAGWSVMLLGFVIGLLLLWDQPVQPVRVALNFVAGCIGGTALLLAAGGGGRWPPICWCGACGYRCRWWRLAMAA